MDDFDDLYYSLEEPDDIDEDNIGEDNADTMGEKSIGWVSSSKMFLFLNSSNSVPFWHFVDPGATFPGLCFGIVAFYFQTLWRLNTKESRTKNIHESQMR